MLHLTYSFGNLTLWSSTARNSPDSACKKVHTLIQTKKGNYKASTNLGSFSKAAKLSLKLKPALGLLAGWEESLLHLQLDLLDPWGGDPTSIDSSNMCSMITASKQEQI